MVIQQVPAKAHHVETAMDSTVRKLAPTRTVEGMYQKL